MSPEAGASDRSEASADAATSRGTPRATGTERTIAILTIIQEELDAVRSIFALSGTKQDGDGRSYYEGRLCTPEAPAGIRVVCYQALGRGNLPALAVAKHVLDFWHPSHLLLVGIAGGISHRGVSRLADVVVASDVVYYELEKQTESGHFERTESQYPPSHSLLLAAQYLGSGGTPWWNLIPHLSDLPAHPSLITGQVACGEKILSDPGSSDLSRLLERYDKAIAVEMEAHGTAYATWCYSGGQVEFGVVRGISDFCDSPKSQEQRDQYKPIAAEAAAAAAHALLEAMHIAPTAASAPPSTSSEISTVVQKLAGDNARTLGELYFGGANAPPAGAESDVYKALRTLMRALVRESGLLPASPIDRVVQALPEEYRRLASLRWQATRNALEGNLLGASALLQVAKQGAARCPNAEDWILRDIILDQRLVEASRFNCGDDSARERLLLLESELQRLRAWSARSPQHYELYRVGRKFLEGIVKTELTGERTLTFGSALAYQLEEVAEALAIGACLGSYNQIASARQVLAELLIHFGLKEGDTDLLQEAVRVMAIEGLTTQLESFLQLYAHLVSPCARPDFLSSEALRLSPSAQPELCKTLCVVFRYLADYVPDEELPDVVEFVDRCYRFDLDRGFAARVMREALETLPALAPRADPSWVMDLAYPLVDGHPVVAGEALDALFHARLNELPEQDLQRITDAVLSRFAQPMPGPRLGLALALADASPDCAARLAAAYSAAWENSRSAESIVFTTRRNLPADGELIAAMATQVVQAIGAANARAVERPQIEYGGYSRWWLLSAILRAGWEGSDGSLVALAENVLRNTSQSSSEKRECLETFLEPAAAGDARAFRLAEALAPRLVGSLPEVLTAKGQALPFGATRTELALLAKTLLTIAGHWSPQLLLGEAAQAVLHDSLDTRLAAASTITRALRVQDAGGFLASWSLLCVLAHDKHYEVRLSATHGLGAVARQGDAYTQRLAEALERLAADTHPQVRAAVTRVAAAWPREAWGRRLMASAAADPNFRVRRVAEEVCKEDPVS